MMQCLRRKAPRPTRRQLDCLAAIEKYAAQYGHSPSIRDLGEALGIKSSATISAHLAALEEQGKIARKAKSPRSVTVVKS